MFTTRVRFPRVTRKTAWCWINSIVLCFVVLCFVKLFLKNTHPVCSKRLVFLEVSFEFLETQEEFSVQGNDFAFLADEFVDFDHRARIVDVVGVQEQDDHANRDASRAAVDAMYQEVDRVGGVSRLPKDVVQEVVEAAENIDVVHKIDLDVGLVAHRDFQTSLDVFLVKIRDVVFVCAVQDVGDSGFGISVLPGRVEPRPDEHLYFSGVQKERMRHEKRFEGIGRIFQGRGWGFWIGVWNSGSRERRLAFSFVFFGEGDDARSSQSGVVASLNEVRQCSIHGRGFTKQC